MFSSSPAPTDSRAADAFTILVGAAIPALIIGRFVFGVMLITALVLLVFTSLPGSRWQDLKGAAGSFLGLLIVITFLTWLPNLYNSLEPWRSLETAARSLLLVVGGVLIWSALSTSPNLNASCRRALGIAAAICIVIGISALIVHPGIYWILHFDKGQFRGWLDLPLLTDMKPISALGPLLVPVLILTAVRERGAWRVVAFAAAAGFPLLALLANSRSSLAGLIAAAVCVIVVAGWRHRSRKAFYFLAILAGAVVILLYWYYVSRPPDIPLSDKWYKPTWLVDYGRQEIWGFTFNVFKQHYLLGQGINTINLVPGANELIPGLHDTPYVPSHPHNWMLEVLAETGIFGFLALLSVVLTLFIWLVRRYLRDGELPVLAAIAISAGYWGSGLFNFSYWSAWWQVSYFLMMAVCLSVGDDEAAAP